LSKSTKMKSTKSRKKNKTKSTSCRNLQYHSCKRSSYQKTKIIKHIHMLHAYPKISWPQPADSLPSPFLLGISSPSHESSSHFTSHAPLVLFHPRFSVHTLFSMSLKQGSKSKGARQEEGSKTEQDLLGFVGGRNEDSSRASMKRWWQSRFVLRSYKHRWEGLRTSFEMVSCGTFCWSYEGFGDLGSGSFWWIFGSLEWLFVIEVIANRMLEWQWRFWCSQGGLICGGRLCPSWVLILVWFGRYNSRIVFVRNDRCGVVVCNLNCVGSVRMVRFLLL
jgi:hypothetical protein